MWPVRGRPYLVFGAEMETGGKTPRSLFRRLYRGRDYSFLLESGGGHLKTSRFSILGGNPFLVQSSRGRELTWINRHGKKTGVGDPIREIEARLGGRAGNFPDSPPHFAGGCVGFLGYDAAHLFETLPCTTRDDLELPDTVFIFPREIVVMDHASGLAKIMLVTDDGDGGRASQRRGRGLLEEFLDRVRGGGPAGSKRQVPRLRRRMGSLRTNQTREEFEARVRGVQEYIRAGDIYQANISRRVDTEFTGDPFELYERLFEINPSPFASFMQAGDMALVGCSPERLVKVEGKTVTTRPIAGTRPRGRDPERDRALSRDLILNEKERAEHLMLLDLERNDLGRLCQYGTVEVDEFMALESYSHVWHIISNIQGRLRDGVGLREVLSACFPGGTITGCPKVRCMEIIDELEPTRRGLYTGSMGYLGFDGRMDMNIIIRTLVVKGGRAYIQTGAGIVADSLPEQEFMETEKKAAALLEALAL